MSAITGIFFRDKSKVDLDLIKNMNDQLVHRGPDGSKVWHEYSLGLGHQMLHTTEESIYEKLPFFDKNFNLALTSDSRIDNRDELLDIFSLDDYRTISDSELILKAYDKWGESCANKLIGDFAFVIWDKSKEKLYCARDHMGVKPFYYYISKDIFAFSSEIKALFSIKKIPKRLNEIKIADYLISNFEDRENTFYENILRLPAANYLIVDSKSTEMVQYWSLNLDKEITYNSNEDYTNEFGKLFTKAVEARLRSALNMGCMLSGGMDSSSIACKARDILSEKKRDSIKTFSFIFNTLPESDEREYINEVLNPGKYDPYFVKGDKLSPLGGIENIVSHLDQALYTFNIYLDCGIYSKAQENNVRVLLDGYDGDTTLSHGELILKEFFRNRKFRALNREIMGLSKRIDSNYWSLFLHGCLIPSIPLNVVDLYKLIRENSNSPFRYNKIIKKEFAEKINLKKRLEILHKYDASRYKKSKEYHFALLSSGEFQFVLEVLDAVCGMYNIEPRYPFFDKRLMEFCLALPVEQKMFHGWDRIILRRAMENVLPPKVQWRRRKSDISQNFDINFIKMDRQLIEDLLSKYKFVEEYISFNELKEAYGRYKKGKYKTNYLEDDSIKVWKVVNLILFLEKEFN